MNGWALLLASTTAAAEAEKEAEPLISGDAGVLAILVVTLAVLFQLNRTPVVRHVFRVLPLLLFCYFVPTTLSTFNVIPVKSPVYDWIMKVILPAALVLLILPLDLRGIGRLGWRPVVMLLAGTLGIVLGAPVALYTYLTVRPMINTPEGHWFTELFPVELPSDLWRGLSALSGSWIGGGANFAAIGQIAGATEAMIQLMVIPDVAVAGLWMACLLMLAPHQKVIDRLRGASTTAIDDLEKRVEAFHERTARPVTLPDLLIILAIAFGAVFVCMMLSDAVSQAANNRIQTMAAQVLPLESGEVKEMEAGALAAAIDAATDEGKGQVELSWLEHASYAVARFAALSLGASAWLYIFVSAFGLILSLTKLRDLDGAGASSLGSAMLYLIVAVIGAKADFNRIAENLPIIVIAAIWMSVHITVLVTVGLLIRAPLFFIAVGSQANIGGAASAPIVAAAYRPSLGSVGALLAILGYVIGTYAGLVCMGLLKSVWEAA
jgi:uncharacterized membrane protein